MKFKERALEGIAEFVIRRHKAIVVIGAALVALSVVSIGRIEIKTEIKDMMPADNPKVVGLLEMNDRFAGSSSTVILVEGPDKTAMAAAAEDLAARIKASPEAGRYTRAVSMKTDRNFFADWGFLLQKPEDIEKNENMWRDINLVNYFRALNDLFEGEYTGDEAEENLETAKEENDAVSALAQIETTIGSLTKAVSRDAAAGMETAGAELADLSLFGEEYSFSPDGSLLVFTLYPNFSEEDLVATQALTKEIRRLQKETASRHPGVSFGYTGTIPVNADEQDALGADMLYPSLIAFALLLVLFLVSFDSVRSILFMLVSLAAGILFNYGILGAALGEVNLLTSVLGALLVGMGIDYGIQIVTSYNSFLSEGMTHEDAIRKAFTRSGGGVLLAALTTSAAFFVFFLSSSKAMVQFGFVAGIGILTCLLAMTLILPSLLLWFGRPGPAAPERRIPQINFAFLNRIGLWSALRRRTVIAVSSAAVAAAGIFAATTIEFEYDMMKLDPQTLPSIIGFKKMLDQFGINSYTATISLENLEEARALKEELEDLRGVAMVSTVAHYIPSREEQSDRLDVIRTLRDRPPNRAPLAYDESEVQALKDEIQRLEYNVIEIGDLSVAGLGKNNRIVRQRDRMVREIFGAEVGRPGNEVFQKLLQALGENPAGASRNLGLLDLGFGVRMEENVNRMLSADRALTAADLPESVRKEYFDESGQWNLLTVFPSDSVVKSSVNLLQFGKDLDGVDKRITGALPLAVMWMQELVNESIKIGIILGVLVFFMMLISFRNLRYALLAALPLAGGLILAFGLAALLRVQLSAFNLTLTPMVIGIGIAYGSYMLQRYLLEEKRLDAALAYTTKAIFLSAVTTMLGFGSLWFVGSYTAISSLGGLIFLGIFSVYVITITLLPALLGTVKTKS